MLNKAFTYLVNYWRTEDMESVKAELLKMLPHVQAVFDAVDWDNIKEQSAALDAWLWQLRDAVEEAEDSLDELDYHRLKEEVKARDEQEASGSVSKLKGKLIRKLTKHVPKNGMLKRLKESVEGLHKAIAGVKDFMGFVNKVGVVNHFMDYELKMKGKQFETSSRSTAIEVFGLEKEKDIMIKWLTEPTVPNLPASLSNLTLGSCCTILADRCRKGGHDWSKIAHIPLMNAALRTTFSSACKSFEFHPSLLFPVDECFKAAKQVEGLSLHAYILYPYPSIDGVKIFINQISAVTVRVLKANQSMDPQIQSQQMAHSLKLCACVLLLFLVHTRHSFVSVLPAAVILPGLVHIAAPKYLQMIPGQAASGTGAHSGLFSYRPPIRAICD
uniref:Disease resistance N-terminal domain-containing protein n=1 Tax=Oryza nivara TaxID=4536 RepID=A0A0E0HPG6_ORYNI